MPEASSVPSGSRTEPSSDREIVVSRSFDAPRELVFEAWTKPEHLAKWWEASASPRTTSTSGRVAPGV